MTDRRAEIADRHSRAEDSNKGAADWLADYAEDAHNDRGWLLSELTRLTADLERMRDGLNEMASRLDGFKPRDGKAVIEVVALVLLNIAAESRALAAAARPEREESNG